MRNNETVRVKLRPTPWWVVNRWERRGWRRPGGGHVLSPLQAARTAPCTGYRQSRAMTSAYRVVRPVADLTWV